MARSLRVGITHGDINGIGYEVILKALAPEEFTQICTPVIFGTTRLLSFYRKSLGINDFYFRMVSSADSVVDGEINLVNISNADFKVEPGKPSPDAGKAALLSLQTAVKALKDGHIDVLVTAPIDKNTIQSEEFKFPGHTEYLAAQAADDAEPLMILFSENLRVALLTTHLPVAEIPKAVTKEKIIHTLKIFDKSLRSDFNCERPKIAVLSLNPHAGDGGLLGSEEEEIIRPAIEEALADGLLVFGPYSADGFFASEGKNAFDGVLAMYHDQGLAPFKALARHGGVNFTAGLPFVRTSPDHGTAYDIAGKNLADPDSMRQAIYSAIDIFRSRANFSRASANPLQKQFDPKKADKEKARKILPFQEKPAKTTAAQTASDSNSEA